MRAAERAVAWIQQPRVAVVIFTGLTAYAVGGWLAVAAVAVGLALLLAIKIAPRVRQRLTKWWLLRG